MTMSSTDPAASALIIGEALIDILEEGGIRDEYVGGSPANAAIGVARLGHRTRLLTRIGRDSRGDAIAVHLANDSVELAETSWTETPTSTAHATIGADGSARYKFDLDWSLPRIPHESAALVHVGSFAATIEPGSSEVLRFLREHGDSYLITLDPNIRPSLLSDHAAVVRRFEEFAAASDLVKLSDEDAEWLYPGIDTLTTLQHIRSLGPQIAIMTLGPDGACGIGESGPVKVDARPVEVVDTISAGDSYMASLISCLLERGLDEVDASLQETLERAACASAIAVSVAGANPPHRHALDALHSSAA